MQPPVNTRRGMRRLQNCPSRYFFLRSLVFRAAANDRRSPSTQCSTATLERLGYVGPRRRPKR